MSDHVHSTDQLPQAAIAASIMRLAQFCFEVTMQQNISHHMHPLIVAKCSLSEIKLTTVVTRSPVVPSITKLLEGRHHGPTPGEPQCKSRLPQLDSHAQLCHSCEDLSLLACKFCHLHIIECVGRLASRILPRGLTCLAHSDKVRHEAVAVIESLD